MSPFFQNKVSGEIVWHKHVVLRFSSILWFAIFESLSTQDKLMSYNLIQVNKCLLLCRGGSEDVDHLFFYCSHRA